MDSEQSRTEAIPTELPRFNTQLLLIFCILAFVCSGTVSMLMSVYLPSVVNDLLGASDEATMSRVGPWLNAAYLAGMTIGGLLLGILSDRFGRVRILAVSLLACGLPSLAAAMVHDWIWIAILRSVSGLGVAGILVTAAVLVSENWPEKSRAVVQGLLAVAFPVGIILSGGLNLVFPDWREAFGVGIVPVLLAILVFWLFSGKEVLGIKKQTLLSIYSPVKTLFYAGNSQKLITGAIVYGFDLVGLWAIFSWMPTWVDSLVGGGESAGEMRGITMMVLGLGGMAGTGVSGFFVNEYGLRRTLLVNFAGTLAICLLLFLTNHSFSAIVWVETAGLSLFFGVSQGALTVYVTELFPTEIRATGTGFCFNIGRVFTTSAVFFVGALVSVLGGYANAMLAFSAAFVVAWAALYWEKPVKQEL